MNVLALVHHENVGPSGFGEVIRAHGHRLDAHRFAQGAPRHPLSAYDALLVCGGPMHADEDAKFPWLAEERAFLGRAIALEVPMIALCLGAQLVARTMGAAVFDAVEPEIGWHEVVTTSDAAQDPVCRVLPPRFHAFHWHYQTHELPVGATVLARSRVGTQGYRLANHVWGFQFHPEVTAPQISGWLSGDGWSCPSDAQAIVNETPDRIGAWNRLGRQLCVAFLDACRRSRK